jgi:hypothetical protein
MPDTPAIVGFVGFVRRNERGYTGEGGKEGDREMVLWRCSRHGVR